MKRKVDITLLRKTATRMGNIFHLTEAEKVILGNMPEGRLRKWIVSNYNSLTPEELLEISTDEVEALIDLGYKTDEEKAKEDADYHTIEQGIRLAILSALWDASPVKYDDLLDVAQFGVMGKISKERIKKYFDEAIALYSHPKVGFISYDKETDVITLNLDASLK